VLREGRGGRAGAFSRSGASTFGGQRGYLGAIAGAVLLVSLTALIAVVNRLGGLAQRCSRLPEFLAMLPLSGREKAHGRFSWSQRVGMFYEVAARGKLQ
jgi:hypothetical protein